MKLYTINTEFFKLDGGAMFGVVPKVLWQRTNPADANNLCTFTNRLLLIEDGDRLTLIDTGMGDKQSDKFFSHYYIHGEDNLDKPRSEEHTSELQSRGHLVCRLLLEKRNRTGLAN